MKKSELRSLIREAIQDIFSEELQTVSVEDAQDAAKKLGVEGKFDLEQLRKGMEVEQEHAETVGSNDKLEFAKIAIDHLKELPDYYTRLAAMEKKKEVSTTSATPGYQVPKAFQGSSDKNKRKRRDVARTSGMKILGADDKEDKL